MSGRGPRIGGRRAGGASAVIGVLMAATCAASLWLAVAGQARTPAFVECQHPVRTGVEVYKLHRVSSRQACPVALALFRWEETERHISKLYGCHGIGHPYLRRHSFDGWRLALKPDFTMSRHGASFAVTGTDFPINCS